jgi:hypothetical protein
MRFVSLLRSAQVVAVVAVVAVLTGPAPAVASMVRVPAGGRVAAATGAQIVLSRRVAPPTSVIGVSGSGFGAHEGVGIAFDSTELTSTHASGSGTFGPVKVTIPASALPARHTISTTGSSTGRVAAAGFTVRTDWAQFRFGPRRSGLNPFENVLGIHNAAGLANSWTLATAAAVQSSPTIAGGVVYVASNDGSPHAVRAATGKPMWTLHTSRPIQSTPAAAHGVVYVGTGGGPVLLALNAGTGARLWGFAHQRRGAQLPVVANGVVYAGATVRPTVVTASIGVG